METLDVKVARHYKVFTDDELRSFEVDVVTATVDVAAYLAVKPQADAVEVAGDEFATACTNAADGGTALISTKNTKRKALLKKLDALGTALQLTVGTDLDYILKAHYKIVEPGEKSDAPLPDPELDSVKCGVLSGTVKGSVKAFPKGVTSIAVEYSDDNGLTWKNGTYSSGKKFLLEGLISRHDYLVRVTYHGTFQRTSNPSAYLPIFVL